MSTTVQAYCFNAYDALTPKTIDHHHLTFIVYTTSVHYRDWFRNVGSVNCIDTEIDGWQSGERKIKNSGVPLFIFTSLTSKTSRFNKVIRNTIVDDQDFFKVPGKISGKSWKIILKGHWKIKEMIWSTSLFILMPNSKVFNCLNDSLLEWCLYNPYLVNHKQQEKSWKITGQKSQIKPPFALQKLHINII